MTTRLSEKAVQQQVVTLLRALGAAVYVLGHPAPNDGRRHRGTGQTPGLPDLFVVLPRPASGGCGVTPMWVEVKASGGRLRPEQAAFRDLCAEGYLAHVVGGVDEVLEFLVKGGWVKAQNLPHYRRPALEKERETTSC